MLATGIAPGTGLDGYVDQAVDQGFGLLGGAQRLLVVDAARGIAPVGDQHQNFTPLAIDEGLRCQVHRIVKGGSAANPHFINRAVELMQLRGERRHLIHVGREGVEGNYVLRANHGMNESTRSLEFESNVFAGARTGVDRQHNRERKL